MKQKYFLTYNQMVFLDERYGKFFRLKVQDTLKEGWGMSESIHYFENDCIAFTQNPSLPEGWPE